MANHHPKIQKLISESHTIYALRGVQALLGWDQEVYMPKGAINARSKQQALISKLAHDALVSGPFKRDLGQCIDLDSGEIILEGISKMEENFLLEAYKEWQKAVCLPAEFVQEMTQITSQAQHAWQDARSKKEFKLFSPHLKKVIQLSKQKATYYGYQDSPYDGLLDEYEPAMTVAEIQPLFAELRDETVRLLKQIQSNPISVESLIGRQFDKTAQWEFGMDMLAKMGFDFNRGRQDYSTHPFTTDFDITDVRITTRISETDFMDGFSSTVHEGGHALYEQGLNSEWAGTALGASCSLGIHESQSRLWENLVAKSWSFWDGIYPTFQSKFSPSLDGMDATLFYRSINDIKPGLIRVAADELTYNLHVMVRFELEQLMINGEVDVDELPGLWNQKYQDYLGITPPDDGVGILQDVHWSAGLIGYFSTYTLGNLYSVLLFDAAKSELPTLERDINRQQFTPLKEWLRINIHQKGRQMDAPSLIKSVTQNELSVAPFVTYLKTKYSDIYSLSL